MQHSGQPRALRGGACEAVTPPGGGICCLVPCGSVCTAVCSGAPLVSVVRCPGWGAARRAAREAVRHSGAALHPVGGCCVWHPVVLPCACGVVSGVVCHLLCVVTSCVLMRRRSRFLVQVAPRNLAGTQRALAGHLARWPAAHAWQALGLASTRRRRGPGAGYGRLRLGGQCGPAWLS